MLSAPLGVLENNHAVGAEGRYNVRGANIYAPLVHVCASGVTGQQNLIPARVL
jgi:hypothetical protein